MALLDLYRLDGRTAVVTGCSRGIGRAAAIALAEAGADIVGVSASLHEEADVARQVRMLGRSFKSVAADLSDRDSAYRAIRDIETAGPVDILVNNAGGIRRSPAVAHADDDWDYVLSLNLTVPFILARELGKGMLAAGSGKIVFVASLLSFQGGLNVVSYTASKGAVAQVTKALANEWAASGINVNAVAPGYIATDVNQQLRDDPKRCSDINSRIPAGAWGNPEDVAPTIAFLCSPAARYVHGTVVTVDGGWMGR